MTRRILSRPEYISLAAADVNGKFLSREKMATPPDPKTAVRAIVARLEVLMQACSGGRTIEGVGISLPGRMQGDRLCLSPV